VISDARFFTRIDVGPQMYTSFNQSVDDAYGAIAMIWRLDFWVAVRTHDNTAATVAAVTRAVDEVDGGAPVERVEFMDSIVARGSENARGLLRLLIIGTVTAVFLSAIGVFGVTAFGVSQRVREFGIRLAVGASPSTVLTHVLWGGMRLAAIGVLVGAVGGFWATRVLERELYGISPTNPWVFAIAAWLLSAVVLLATWLPARRAARIDPVVALRTE
jgi:putative ABC transport system permease protein